MTRIVQKILFPINRFFCRTSPKTDYHDYFREEEYKGEKAITWLRLAMGIIIAGRATIFYFFKMDFYGHAVPGQMLLVAWGIVLFYLFLFLDLRFIFHKKPQLYKPFYRYIISVVDVGVITMIGNEIMPILQSTYKEDVFIVSFSFILVILYMLVIFGSALRFDPWNTLFTTALSMIGGVFLFYRYMDSFTTSIAGGQLIATGLLSAYIARSMRKKIIKIHETALLERYLPKELVEEINQKRISLNVGGSLKNVAVLFSDIRGFTQFSEGRTPTEIIEFLNLYLSDMIEVVFDNHGTLDKFIGDALMAIYGAPIQSGDEAERAVRTALQMLHRLVDFNQKIAQIGYQPIAIGIGIAYGEVIAGNIGSPKRMEYTVIGDTVNVASRLEQLNKELQSSLLVSQEIFNMLENKFQFSPPHHVALRGKNKTMNVYQVLAERNG